MSKGEGTDLLCRAWRERLSSDEERSLRALLTTSLEARVMDGARPVFEGDSSVRAGDDELVVRLAERARGRHRNRGLAQRPRFALALAAAALVVSGVAAGAFRLGARSGATGLLGVQEVGSVVARPSAPAGTVPNARDSAREPATAPVGSAPAGASAVSSGARAASSAGAASRAQPPASAKELFAEANRARRAGDPARARELYGVLLARYPGAPESALARLALGKLLLQAGEAAAAAEHFERLARGGSLQAEARWGAAEAYARLGRARDEQRVLEQIVRDHPNTPYATAAAARLGHEKR